MRNKRVLFFIAVGVVLVLLAAAYLWAPGAVPPVQQPLLTLSNANFSEFEKAFEADPNAPRMVLLLSPT